MAASNWEGQTLGGRYQIGELLGQGGMSSVYKATDPNLRRSVAIKLIHPHLSNNPEFVRRFEEEATGVARLRHPNIIQMYDFNHEGGVYYMVMEYVAGETLQARLKRLNAAGRHLPLREALKYTLDICNAAGYAHERGMIHRDIKPANVMLDVHGNAILMDFGIARMVGGQQHTATGAVLGTALYMAPEQIQGLHPDARADIYSIGVMLFEALSGRPPFEADSAMTLMMMHLNDPVPELEPLHPGIPDEVQEIANKALEKDRARRYQSGEEMAAALQQALAQVAESPAATAPAPARQVAPAPAMPEQPKARQVAPAPAKATPPAGAEMPRPEATFVEPAAPIPIQPTAQAMTPPDATVVEPVVEIDPHATYVEPWEAVAARAAMQAGPAAEVNAAGAPAARPSAPPTTPKRGLGGKTLGMLIGVLLVVVAGGAFLFSQLGPGEPEPESTAEALIQPAEPTESQVIAVIQPTETVALPVAAPSSTDTPLPEPTEAPTETVLPSPTSPPPLPVIGGADKIAYFSGSEIWVANMDGSDLTQLTQDGMAKNYLRWLPDGSGLSYISGKCILTASLEAEVRTITCFNSSEYLDSFEVSPDGQRVALSLDRQLYLLPFDLEGLSQADRHSKLEALAECADLAPYQRNAAYYARWSLDSKRLAVVIMGVLKDGRRGDLVQVIPVDQCIPNPLIAIHFPEPHFDYPEYNRTPTLQNLAWNGQALFVFHGLSRNEGFGNLHIFNMETYKASLSVNPVRGACCYRDPQWSPDGNYLLFAFQDMLQGSASTTQLYYVPYGSIGTGATYEPLPLPEISNPREQPQPVLRPAAGG
jgi:tRNA A-37 threonylcarbamoyl transferase component Bud32